MPLFSQRKGIRPLQKAIQRESIDDDLRHKLWSATQLAIWEHYSRADSYGFIADETRHIDTLIKKIWLHYYKMPLHTTPDFAADRPKSAYKIMRENFMAAKWWEVLDFLEFLIKEINPKWSNELTGITNSFLESESSAYRVVNKEFVEITDQNEISAIEDAIDQSNKIIQSHLARAVELLSDRQNRDYRNSIKESISAVEAACQEISGKPKGTLGDCLTVLKKKTAIHPALEGAFQKLYGYTSDAGGIRHALTNESEHPTFADAKFMLVACSTFVNFLQTKIAETGGNS